MPPRKGDRLQDLTGKVFGRLTVLAFAGYKKTGQNKEIPCWLCECDCEEGKTVIVTGNNLRQGGTKSCGCLQHETRVNNGKKNFIDLAGKIFHEWYVEKRVEDRISKSGIHAVQYLCVCTCGEKRIVLAASLLNGESTNCGHLRQETLCKLLTKDMIGQTFGELLVLSKVEGTHPVKWHCVCSCGLEIDAYGSALRSGATISCGHIKMSHGEYYICQYLKEHNIEYAFNKTMIGLRSPKGGRLRIDFQLYKNNKLICVIEYQGEQHYAEPKTEAFKDFGRQQREVTDKIKRDFFKNKNIPFHEIRYAKRKNTVIKRLNEILIKYDFINDNTVPSSQETA